MSGIDAGMAARGAAIAASGKYKPGPVPDEPPEFADEVTPDEPPPDDGRQKRPLFPPPTAPLEVARKLYGQYRIGGLRTLLAWRGGWMHWETTHWSERDVAHLRSEIYDLLGKVDYKHPIREKGITVDHEIRAWSPDKHKVANVIEALAAIGHLSTDIDPPSWIDLHSAAERKAGRLISCRNGLLDLSTRTVGKHTPALFNVVSVPFDYHADPGEPTHWLGFLKSIWPDDPDSVALLQEYVGYVLSGRTDMQKMLLLIGPTRSGKGTIARMLVALVGRRHVAGPTLASLGTNFGSSPLIGKPLAIISDARLGDTPSHTVVERLLSITGEDMLTVDRKFKEPWSGKLSARFVILSNELPKFKDSSGAIANRLLILQMTNSFLGREDRTLDERLHAELPGILAWALQGLDRLVRNGKFTVPRFVADAANLMMDLASPVSAFVRDRCHRSPDASVPTDDLYAAWKCWAESNGHHAGAKSTFGRNLRAVVPELKISQPRANGDRERRYELISLRAHNADHPVPPVPGADDRGPVGSGTGSSRAEPTANPQVNGYGTGGTGESALWAQYDGSGTGSSRASGGATPSPGHEREPFLFGVDDEDTSKRCACGNSLGSTQARTTGRCKPCRDKLMAGYDS